MANECNLAGDYDRALKEARSALDTDEAYWLSHYVIAENFSMRGLFSEAARYAEKAYQLSPRNPRVMGLLAGVLTRLRNLESVPPLLDALAHAAPIGMVFYFLPIDKLVEAADWFSKAIEYRELFAVMYAHSPLTRALRETASWNRLSREMNLPPKGAACFIP
jgi:tetratricopeptide (TPR) repeat protein